MKNYYLESMYYEEYLRILCTMYLVLLKAFNEKVRDNYLINRAVQKVSGAQFKLFFINCASF